MNKKALDLTEGANVRRSLRTNTTDIIVVAEKIQKKKPKKKSTKNSQQQDENTQPISINSSLDSENVIPNPPVTKKRPLSQPEISFPKQTTAKKSSSEVSVLTVSSDNSPDKKIPSFTKKKSTQQSIFSFVKTIDKTATQQDKGDVLRFYAQALDAVKSRKVFQFKNAIAAAKRCEKSTVAECIDSKLFKHAVFRKEQDKFLSGDNLEASPYDEWLDKFYGGYFEDSVISVSELPNFSVVPAGLEEHSHLFGQCLELSEFLLTFEVFLESKAHFSAETIMKAMLNGFDGYFSVTSLILVAFLRAFKSHYILDRIKFGYYPLDKISSNYKSIGELVKLVVTGKPTLIQYNDNKMSNLEAALPYDMTFHKFTRVELPVADPELVKSFEKVEFYELSVEDQLKVFEHLMYICSVTGEFQAHFEQIPEVSKKLIELEPSLLEKVKAYELYGPRKSDNIGAVKKQLRDLKVWRLKLELSLVYKKRTQMLGVDRRHWKYYFFNSPLNPGIFVTDESHYPVVNHQADTESDSNDELARELRKLVDATFPQKVDKPRWYKIGTIAEFGEFNSRLNIKGVREHHLVNNLSLFRASIEKKMSCKVVETLTRSVGNQTQAEIVGRDVMYLFDVVKGLNTVCVLADMKQIENSILTAAQKENPLDSFKQAILSLLDVVLPCAYVKQVTFPAKRRQFLKNYIGGVSKWSQLAFAVQYICFQVVGDMTKETCPRCMQVFKSFKIKNDCISCDQCCVTVHVECTLDVESDPSPLSLGWKCKECKISSGQLKKYESESEEEPVEEEEPEPIVVNGRTFRCTDMRKNRIEEETVLSRPESRSWEASPVVKKGRKRQRVDSDSDDSRCGPIGYSAPETVPDPDPLVLARYEAFTKDYRILQSLAVVGFTGHKQLTVTILGLKSKLYEIGSVAILDGLFLKLWKAAEKYYVHNARKCEALTEHFVKFFPSGLDSAGQEDDSLDSVQEEAKVKSKKEGKKPSEELEQVVHQNAVFLSLDDSNH